MKESHMGIELESPAIPKINLQQTRRGPIDCPHERTRAKPELRNRSKSSTLRSRRAAQGARDSELETPSSHSPSTVSEGRADDEARERGERDGEEIGKQQKGRKKG